MDHRSEAREFLRTRRAKVTPEQANLTPGGNRRVPGLRHEEVLDALARALDRGKEIRFNDLLCGKTSTCAGRPGSDDPGLDR